MKKYRMYRLKKINYKEFDTEKLKVFFGIFGMSSVFLMILNFPIDSSFLVFITFLSCFVPLISGYILHRSYKEQNIDNNNLSYVLWIFNTIIWFLLLFK